MVSKFKQLFLGASFFVFLFFGFFITCFSIATSIHETIISGIMSIVTFAPLSLVFKELYFWNNGICRQTGKPWIEKLNCQDYRTFTSEDSKGNTFETHCEYLNIYYNDEEAKQINLHFKKISNLKAFG